MTDSDNTPAINLQNFTTVDGKLDTNRLLEHLGSAPVAISFSATSFERYKAARAGVPFDPASVLPYYPEGKAGEKARRRGEEPTVSVPFEHTRDMFSVLENLNNFEAIYGAHQLPAIPLRSLTPVTVINRVADYWYHSVAHTYQPTATSDLREEIEAVVNLVLHEAHPDRQDENIPRRRALDTDTHTPLLIDTLPRVRDRNDQKEYVEICEIDDQQFNIVKSAVHAYVTLIGQHQLEPDMSAVTELYRRGLLPLSILIENKDVITAISGIIGRTEKEITEAVALVEPTHVEHRPEAIRHLLTGYDNHLEAVLHHRQKIIAEQAAQQRDNVPSTRTISQRRSASPLSNGAGATSAKVETDLRDMIERIGLVIMDSSVFSDDMRTHVLGARPFLPIPDYEVDLNPASNDDFVILMNPANVWFESCYYYASVEIKDSVVQAGLQLPGLMSAKSIKDVELEPIFDPYERTISTLAHLYNARSTDVYVESVMAFTVACDLLENGPRDERLVKIVKDLTALTGKLETLHADSLRAVRDTGLMSKELVSTDREWGKIVNNPLTSTGTQEECVLPGDADKVFGSMMFHVPICTVDEIFSNAFTGMQMGYDRESFDKRVNEIMRRDPDGKVMRFSRSIRHHYGTAGKGIVSNNGTIHFDVEDHDRLRAILAPVAERYAGLELTPQSLRSDLATVIARDPRQPSNSARVAER